MFGLNTYYASTFPRGIFDKVVILNGLAKLMCIGLIFLGSLSSTSSSDFLKPLNTLSTALVSADGVSSPAEHPLGTKKNTTRPTRMAKSKAPMPMRMHSALDITTLLLGRPRLTVYFFWLELFSTSAEAGMPGEESTDQYKTCFVHL
nr:unnamed protein product [Callosobruchus analis]